MFNSASTGIRQELGWPSGQSGKLVFELQHVLTWALLPQFNSELCGVKSNGVKPDLGGGLVPYGSDLFGVFFG